MVSGLAFHVGYGLLNNQSPPESCFMRVGSSMRLLHWKQQDRKPQLLLELHGSRDDPVEKSKRKGDSRNLNPVRVKAPRGHPYLFRKVSGLAPATTD